MKIRNLLVALLLFLSLGALFGGGAFLITPDGSSMGMSAEIDLRHSPFESFLIPGLILFTMFGLLPICVVWGLLMRRKCRCAQLLNMYPDMHWAWTWSVYVSFALLIWIYMEVYFLQSFHFLQSFFFFYGILLLALLLLRPMRRLYSVSEKV